MIEPRNESGKRLEALIEELKAPGAVFIAIKLSEDKTFKNPKSLRSRLLRGSVEMLAPRFLL